MLSLHSPGRNAIAPHLYLQLEVHVKTRKPRYEFDAPADQLHGVPRLTRSRPGKTLSPQFSRFYLVRQSPIGSHRWVAVLSRRKRRRQRHRSPTFAASTAQTSLGCYLESHKEPCTGTGPFNLGAALAPAGSALPRLNLLAPPSDRGDAGRCTSVGILLLGHHPASRRRRRAPAGIIWLDILLQFTNRGARCAIFLECYRQTSRA